MYVDCRRRKPIKYLHGTTPSHINLPNIHCPPNPSSTPTIANVKPTTYIFTRSAKIRPFFSTPLRLAATGEN